MTCGVRLAIADEALMNILSLRNKLRTVSSIIIASVQFRSFAIAKLCRNRERDVVDFQAHVWESLGIPERVMQRLGLDF